MWLKGEHRFVRNLNRRWGSFAYGRPCLMHAILPGHAASAAAAGQLPYPQAATEKGQAAKFTIAIKAAGKRNWREALELWEDAKVAGFHADVIVGSATAAALSAAGQWRQCLGLLRALPAGQMQLGVFAYNAGLTSCARCERWSFGLAVLKSMHMWDIQMQIVTFNACTALLRPRNSWQAAEACLQRAATSDFRPNVVSYNTLLSFASPWPYAGQLLRAARAQGLKTDSTTWNSAQSGQQAWCAAMLSSAISRGVEIDVVAINTGSTSCAALSAWTSALQLLRWGKRRGLRMETATRSAASSACEASGKWAWALECCRVSAAGMAADAISMGAGITSWSCGQIWEAASCTLLEVTSLELQADIVSFGALLHACDGGSCWDVALRVIQQMAAAKIRSNAVAQSAAMATCRSFGKWPTAAGLLSATSPHSSVLYNALVGTCASCAEWRSALHFCMEATQHALQPDSITCSTAAAACGACSQWQLATARKCWVLSEAAGCKPENADPSLTALLSLVALPACAAVVYSILVACEAQALDRSSLGTMVHALCQAWQWRLALQLVVQAAKHELYADAVSTSEVVSACVHSDAMTQARWMMHQSREAAGLLRRSSGKKKVPSASFIVVCIWMCLF
ncbi:unnamed protein product [Effrenium voratum]|nr:unnamed protein product [Effrenium voratum]